MRLGAVAGRAGAFEDFQGSEHSDEREVGRAQAPYARGDLSLASAHVCLVRGECGRSVAYRAVDCWPRVNGDDAALLPRELDGVEVGGGGDPDAVVLSRSRKSKSKRGG